MPTAAADDALIRRLTEAGYARVEPPVTIDADLVRDLVGETLARRLFLTTDADGAELCLRPDYTIPVVHAHMAGPDPMAPGAYCYCGPVFRQRPGLPGEFRQAGVEKLGASDREAAEAEVIALAMEGARLYAGGPLKLKLGDVGVFTALLSAFGLPPVWRRRLAKDFRRGGMLEHDLKRLAAPRAEAPGHAGLLAALDRSDAPAARALVADLLSIAGIRTVGGRTAADIAERFLEQAALGVNGPNPAQVTLLARILSVEGAPRAAEAEIAALCAEAGVDIAPALAAMARRHALLEGLGVDLDGARFALRFGRDLDYYTGVVFEIHGGEGDDAPLVGGGRYERLTEMMAARLGLHETLSAVGCAFLVDRLAGAGGRA